MFISRAHLVEVFFTKLILNIKAEAAETYLSYAWWLLEPILMVAVFYVVFGVFLARGTPDFVVFLVCGKIPFLWFSKSVTNSSNSIIAGRGLINQVAIPKPFFPLLVIFQDASKQFIVFGFMFMFLAAFGSEVSWVWFTVIFVVFTQFLFIAAAALTAAAITPFLPDFKFLISTAMLALMFGSGVFYDYESMLMPEHRDLFLMNPLANLLKNYRQVLMENQMPDWDALVNICLISLIAISALVVYYRKTDKLYARLVQQ